MATETLKIGLEFATDAAVAAAKKFQKGIENLHGSMGRFYQEANQGVEALGDAFAKFNLAIGGAEKAFQMFKGALELAKFSAETRQLEAQFKALGASLGSMENATDGAVKKTDLMRFALKAMQGDLRLTKDGMDVVLKAADTLGDKGFGDTMQIAEKLMEVLRTGRTTALKEFGIELDTVGGKQADLNTLMQKFQEIAANPIPVDEQLQSIERLQTATDNWINDMKAGIGGLFNLFGQFADQASDWVSGSRVEPFDRLQLSRQKKLTDEYDIAEIQMALNGGGNLVPLNEQDKRLARIRERYGELLAEQKQAMAWKPSILTSEATGPLWQGSRGEKQEEGPYSAGAANVIGGYRVRGLEGPGGFFNDKVGRDMRFYDYGGELSKIAANDLKFDATGRFANLAPSPYDNVNYPIGDMAAPTMLESGEAKQSRMAKRLGLDENFKTLLGGHIDGLMAFGDALEKVGISADNVGGAMHDVANATAAAMNAWITGEGSAADAIKRIISMRMAAIAQEAAVKALFETAMGFAALWWNPAEAAGHFKSAALFTATAAAAGIAAKATYVSKGGGGGGGGASADVGARGAGGGYTRGPSAGNGEQGGNIYYITIGDGFVGKPEELGKILVETIGKGKKMGRVHEGGPARFGT